MFSLVLICRHNKNIISLPIMPTKDMLFGGIMDLSAMQNSSVFTISPGPLPTKKKVYDLLRDSSIILYQLISA